MPDKWVWGTRLTHHAVVLICVCCYVVIALCHESRVAIDVGLLKPELPWMSAVAHLEKAENQD